MDKIKDFQKQNRLEQLRRLVADRIKNEGYSLADFKKEYPAVNIKMQMTKGRFHDRYIILDYDKATEKIYHCGPLLVCRIGGICGSRVSHSRDRTPWPSSC